MRKAHGCPWTKYLCFFILRERRKLKIGGQKKKKKHIAKEVGRSFSK